MVVCYVPSIAYSVLYGGRIGGILASQQGDRKGSPLPNLRRIVHRAWVGATTIGANFSQTPPPPRAGASPAPTIHGPGGLIRGLVGAGLAPALEIHPKFAPMGATTCSINRHSTGRPEKSTHQDCAWTSTTLPGRSAPPD